MKIKKTKVSTVEILWSRTRSTKESIVRGDPLEQDEDQQRIVSSEEIFWGRTKIKKTKVSSEEILWDRTTISKTKVSTVEILGSRTKISKGKYRQRRSSGQDEDQEDESVDRGDPMGQDELW